MASEYSALILLEEKKYYIGIRGIRFWCIAFGVSRAFELVYNCTIRKYGEITLQQFHPKIPNSTLQNNSLYCRC